jgi:hypothetical protein
MHINSVSTLHFKHKHQQGQKSLPSLAPQPSSHCQYNNLTDLFSFVFAGTLQSKILFGTSKASYKSIGYPPSWQLQITLVYYMLGRAGHRGYVFLDVGTWAPTFILRPFFICWEGWVTGVMLFLDMELKHPPSFLCHQTTRRILRTYHANF